MPLPVEVPVVRVTARLPEGSLATLLDSPDFYPIHIDFSRRVVAFVRMSRETYRKSVFLDHRTHYLGADIYGMRLDDLLFRAIAVPMASRPVHYILHPTFSCSTLLARYFELLSSCLVLKEPMLLTQMAFAPRDLRDWDDVFRLSLRMLARTYGAGDLVVIKPHEPFNALAAKLLSCSTGSTITFLTTSLKRFVVSVLKSQSRRNWVRTRIPFAARAAKCDPLIEILPDVLEDAQAAAYLWLVNQFICKQLCAGEYRDRVLMLDADLLADSPQDALKAVMGLCAAPISDPTLRKMIEHPTIRSYSKDLSRPYDSSSRANELAELERSFGQEADSAAGWVVACGMGEYLT